MGFGRNRLLLLPIGFGDLHLFLDRLMLRREAEEQALVLNFAIRKKFKNRSKQRLIGVGLPD